MAKRLIITLSDQQHAALKIHAAIKHSSMGAVVVNALTGEGVFDDTRAIVFDNDKDKFGRGSV